MPSPVNDNFDDAIQLNLVGQVRTIRSVDGSTFGATIEPDEPQRFSYTADVTATVWYKVVVPEGTTGPFRIGIPNPSHYPTPGWYFTAAVLWRQRGTGFAGLQYIDDGTSSGSAEGGLHNNCEGYAQGRDNYMWDYAFGAGEVYYIQVATFSVVGAVGADFTLQWTYDPLEEPTELTGPKTPSNCPGTPLTTHGFHTAYFNAISGFPARFSPGRSIPHAPAMPAVGHAFYVEEVREFGNLHIRRLIIGWTEATGPFLYGYLDHHGWARTWSVDNEDAVGVGAASLLADASVHQGITFYDNPTGAERKSTIRTIAGLGDKEPTYDWAPAGSHIGDMAWGGPGRPGSFFEEDWSTTPRSVVEWDLAGNLLDGGLPDRPADYASFGGPWIWCSLDGSKLYQSFTSNVDFQLHLYSVDIATHAVTREQQMLSGTILGVRSSSGEIVAVASEVELYDPAVTDDSLPPNPSGEFAFPLVSSVSTWASSFGRHWQPLGVTADGQHLFFGLFYPLTPHPGGADGSRDFVMDVWWMDLDTGVCEHKFFLAHPFHDTFMVPDTVPTPPTTNVRNVRLYRQADVGR